MLGIHPIPEYIDDVNNTYSLIILLQNSGPFRSILSGVVNISARGRIGTVELDFARHVGLNVIDVSPADAAREYN